MEDQEDEVEEDIDEGEIDLVEDHEVLLVDVEKEEKIQETVIHTVGKDKKPKAANFAAFLLFVHSPLRSCFAEIFGRKFVFSPISISKY